MPAILRGPGQKLRDYVPVRYVSTYVVKWPTAKGRPYRPNPLPPPRFPHTHVAVRCEYSYWPETIRWRITRKKSTAERCFDAVQAAWGVSRNDLVAQRRLRAHARPRQALCALLREFTPMSLPQIGRKIDRDHTTVMYAIEAADRHVRYDPEFRARYEAARKSVERGAVSE